MSIGMPGPTGRSSGLKGTGFKQINTPTMNSDQQQLFSQLMQGVNGNAGGGLKGGIDYLSKLAGGDQSHFDELEAPAMRQFGALQGNLASRFSGGFGSGGSGGRNSSGFQNTMGEAGASLAESLQSQRMNMRNDALSQLLGLSNQLLGHKTQETSLMSKKIPFWQQLLGSLAGGGAQVGGVAGLKGLGIF